MWKGISDTKGFEHRENLVSPRSLIIFNLLNFSELLLTRVQPGNIGQASACSAGLGMDSHNPHWHSRPRPTGDHRQMCPRSPRHRRIHFHILSTAWFGRSSSNLRQEWPLSEASRSYLPTPFRSSSSSSWSLAASLKASSSTSNC